MTPLKALCFLALAMSVPQCTAAEGSTDLVTKGVGVLIESMKVRFCWVVCHGLFARCPRSAKHSQIDLLACWLPCSPAPCVCSLLGYDKC